MRVRVRVRVLIPRSHLLLHDDSISTRLVSYILYLPNSPSSLPSTSHPSLVSASSTAAAGKFTKGWDPVWGGALELYPVQDGKEVGVPGVKRLGKVDVKWGQIVFFEVQPGRSYHAVEEVIVGDGRQRLGVSGWYVSSQCTCIWSGVARRTDGTGGTVRVKVVDDGADLAGRLLSRQSWQSIIGRRRQERQKERDSAQGNEHGTARMSLTSRFHRPMGKRATSRSTRQSQTRRSARSRRLYVSPLHLT